MLDPFGDPFKWRMRYHNAHTLLGVFCIPYYTRKDIIRFGVNDNYRTGLALDGALGLKEKSRQRESLD